MSCHKTQVVACRKQILRLSRDLASSNDNCVDSLKVLVASWKILYPHSYPICANIESDDEIV